MTARVHLVAMSTGGAGKTFTSVAIAQYMKSKEGANVLCLDTDPATPKFVQHRALDVRRIDITVSGMNIDRSKFDDMIDFIIEHEGECVIDSGASNFLPLMAYMVSQDVIEVLKGAGKEVILHAPLMGGDAFTHTLNGLDTMLRNLNSRVVLWENEWRGLVQAEGKDLYQSKPYRENKDRVIGVVKISRREDDLYTETLRRMTENYLTYQEVFDSTGLFKAMQKQRLKLVQREIFDQLAKLGL